MVIHSARPTDQLRTGKRRPPSRSSDENAPRRAAPTPLDQLDSEARGSNQRMRATPSAPGVPAASSPPTRGPAALAAQIAAAKAKVAAAAAAAKTTLPSVSSRSATTGGSTGNGSLEARLAAARAKVSALSSAPGRGSNASSGTTATAPATAPIGRATPASTVSTGTSTTKPDWRHARKPKAPRFSTVRANAPPEPAVVPEPAAQNPYLAPVEATEVVPKARSTHAPLKFNRPGRYIEQAETLRREAAMEALKQRIAERTRKAGLTEAGEERAAMLRKPQPPNVEWWDEPFASHQADGTLVSPYDQVENEGLEKLDAYVQHPIEIPPVERGRPPPRGVMLTSKEARKLRRQRRAADLSDKRDRIKMGLLPPPPDKVKLSNLVRVLGSAATADPTRVEAKVRREIVARYEAHVAQNEERKLTPEQRAAKRETKRELGVEAHGLHEALYSIAPAMSHKQRYKISTNARQLGLTGRVVYAPGQTAVLVQGGPKELRKYEALLLRRIDWTDSDPGVPPRGEKPLPEGESTIESFKTNRCVRVFGGAAVTRTWDRFNIFHVDSVAAPAREAFAPRPELWDRVRAVVRLQDKGDDL